MYQYYTVFGRIGRVQFIVRTLVWLVAVVVGIIAGTIAAVIPLIILALLLPAAPAHIISALLGFCLGMALYWPGVAMAVHRVRDIGLNVWYVVAACLVFGALEFLIFSRISGLTIYIGGQPIMSWVCAVWNFGWLIALCCIPGGTFTSSGGLGSTPNLGDDRASWADAAEPQGVRMQAADAAPTVLGRRRQTVHQPAIRAQFGMRPTGQSR